MSDLDALLDERKMPTEDVRICLDLALLDERDKATAAHARAYAKAKDEDRMVPAKKKAVQDARAELEAIETKIREKSFVLRIEGLDRFRYNQMMVAAPPRKGRNEPFDPTKFFMLVAKATAKYVDAAGEVHDITKEQWDRIDKALTDGEYDRIARAVLNVNRTAGGQDVGFFGSDSDTTSDSSEISD